MGNREKAAPTAERPNPEEPKPLIAARKDLSGAVEQPLSTVVKDEAEFFKERALEIIGELKRDAEFTRNFSESLAFCVERFSTLQEIQEYMADKYGLGAESVEKLYDVFVAKTADVLGGNAYAVYSMECAQQRLEAQETVLKEQAESFKKRALEMLDQIKRNDAAEKNLCESLAFCLERFCTLRETQLYMELKNGLSAEYVKQLYETILENSGDANGGKAYAEYTMVCAKQKQSKHMMQMKLSGW